MPAPTTSNTFVTTLSFRLGQRLTTAAQLSPFLNFALNKIEGLGSYEWDLSLLAPTPSAVTGLVFLPTDCHIGKAIWFNHLTDTTPIKRIVKPEGWLTTTPANVSKYDSWFLSWGLGVYPAVANFFPGLAVGVPVNMLYHRIPTALDGTSGTAVPWVSPDLDDLLVLIAECEAKRELNLVGWQDLVTLVDKRLAEAIQRYSSTREVPGILEWAQRPTEKT